VQCNKTSGPGAGGLFNFNFNFHYNLNCISPRVDECAMAGCGRLFI